MPDVNDLTRRAKSVRRPCLSRPSRMLPRRLPLLVAFLVLVATPGLLASGDADDDSSFILSRFQTDTTYAYDATYRSLRDDVRQWTVPHYLTLEVGRPIDGRLPITIHQKVAPWDLGAVPAAPGDDIRHAHGKVTRVLWLDVATGTLGHLDTIQDTAIWTLPETGKTTGTDVYHRADDESPGPIPFQSTEAWPGTRYVDADDKDAGIDGVGHYVAKGELAGRTVYQLGDPALVTRTLDSRRPTCDHPYPQPGLPLVPARDPDQTPKTNVLVSRAAWFDPVVPFPVHSVCRVVYPHEAGGLRTEVLYELTLARHTSGPSIPTIPRQAAVDAPAETSPQANGVPTESRHILDYPLREAYTEAARVEEVGYRQFKNPDGTPLVLAGARYRVDPVEPQSEDPVIALKQDAERTLDKAQQRERAILSWMLTLRNDDGHELVIKTARRMEGDGSIVHLGKEVEGFRDSATLPEHDAPPARLADLDAILLAWQKTTHETLEWAAQPGMYWLQHDLDDGTLTIGAKKPRAEQQYTYRLNDGALVHDGTWTDTPRTDAPPDMPTGGPLTPAAVRIRPIDGPGIPKDTGLWAATILLAATAFQATKWLLPKLAAAPLYAKIAKEHVLDHRTRDDIIHYIDANPGANPEEIRRRLALGRGTTLHHLDTLERNHLVVSVKSRGRRCYFRPGQVDASKKGVVAALRTPAAEAFYATITAHPGTTQKEMAEALGVSHPAVWYQAKRLAEAGAIRMVREGGLVRYFPLERPAAVAATA